MGLLLPARLPPHISPVVCTNPTKDIIHASNLIEQGKVDIQTTCYTSFTCAMFFGGQVPDHAIICPARGIKKS